MGTCDNPTELYVVAVEFAIQGLGVAITTEAFANLQATSHRCRTSVGTNRRTRAWVQIRGGGATPGLCGEWVSPAPQQIGCIRTLASRSSKLQDNRRTGSGKQRSDGRGGGEDHSFQSAPPTRSTQNCSPAGLPTNKQQQLTPRNPQQTIMVAAPSKGQAEVILVGA